MNIAEIEANLRALSEKAFDPATFPLRILEIYDAPRATVTKLQNGSMNKGERSGDLLWKGKLFFRASASGKAAATVDEMKLSNAVRLQKPRFLLSSDGAEAYCFDTKADEGRALPIQDLGDLFDFMLPLAGIERYQAAKENPADIKAAGRLARLYDAILDCNPDWKKPERAHALNLFMTRLLFCMFAEDTGILEAGLFSSAINEFTKEDGSNTGAVLKTIFDVMDAKERTDEHPGFAQRFPYVNGGLFRVRSDVPVFSKLARRLLIEAARLTWSEINPDIFGSMIQGVVDKELRADLGMHYTSVPNILRLLRPLFLDDLEREFAAAHGNATQLSKLLSRIYSIRVFDPACGSGNFLIIAYREMRRLEMRIFLRLKDLSKQFTLPMSQVRLGQFYGIEYADFAAETAKLSLWIAEHQLNKEFEQIIGPGRPALPLQDSGNITCGNATRVAWETVCPPNDKAETFIVGNPPYLGGKKLSAEQSLDMDAAGLGSMKQVDYVGCWFLMACAYGVSSPARIAFVSTSSICQGEQVHLLWPAIWERGFEIEFAHVPFRWANSAADNAGVWCVIIGLRKRSPGGSKHLYGGDTLREVKNISPYLTEGPDICVKPTSDSLFGLTEMWMGSNPVDGKRLVLTESERNAITNEHPEADQFIRRYMGGNDFMSGTPRYCLWVEDADLAQARAIPGIASRIDACGAYRLTAGRDARRVASVPHRFCYRTYKPLDGIIVPNTSSSARPYIPVDFVDKSVIVNKEAFVIYEGEAWVFALLSSTLHRVWLASAGGRLGNGYRYSVKLVYNTFPVPELSSNQKTALEELAWAVISERENLSGKTLSEMYERDEMPKALIKAHQDVDAAVESIYRGRAFRSDAERLEHLFKLYASRVSGAGTNMRAA